MSAKTIRWIGIFFTLDGTAILLMWVGALAQGVFPDGLLNYQDGNYPLLHVTAEVLMGSLALLAGLLLLRHDPAGRPLAFLAAGMLAYSSVNSMGFALRNDLSLMIPMAVTLLGTVLCAWFLISRKGGLS